MQNQSMYTSRLLLKLIDEVKCCLYIVGTCSACTY